MFGYVQIRKPELKIKDFEIYQGFYCGLCTILKERYGLLGELTLTYDMTFLVLLLSSVYDIPVTKEKRRCIVHPAKRHLKLFNQATEYAADLSIILSYYHFLDDKKDEASKKAWAGEKLYKRKFMAVSKKYHKKAGAIERCLQELSELEKRKETDIHKLADCFGKVLMVIFSYNNDVFLDYFRILGYHLGCFIYIMDAYDDVGKDIGKGCFNPFVPIQKEADFESRVEDILMFHISEAAAAYRKLPCVSYQDVLGNILYAGVWNRFDQIKRERSIVKERKQEGEKNERSI